MQINNWFDFSIFFIFTLAVILVGLPVSFYLLIKGAQGFKKYKFLKLPKNFLMAPGLGAYSVEIIFYGLLMLVISVWYLFFDKGGQLANCIGAAKKLLGA